MLRRLRMRALPIDCSRVVRRRFALHSLRFVVQSRASLHLEIIALRHQLTVVHRSRRPSSLHISRSNLPGVALARLARLPHGRSRLQAGDGDCVASPRVSPILDMEKPTPHRPPSVPADVRALIPDMSTANPLWVPSDSRRASEVGIEVSQSTVAKYMRRHPRPPSQTLRTCLTNHASQFDARLRAWLLRRHTAVTQPIVLSGVCVADLCTRHV